MSASLIYRNEYIHTFLLLIPAPCPFNIYTKLWSTVHFYIFITPCPLFVHLADEGWVEGEIVERIAEEYLNPIKDTGIDVLVLGCTHYPLLKNTIQKIVGDEITLVDSAEETASQIKQILVKKGLLNDSKTPSERDFYLTDVSDTFISVAGRFLGEKIDKIEMVDIVGTTTQPSL